MIEKRVVVARSAEEEEGLAAWEWEREETRTRLPKLAKDSTNTRQLRTL